ncbi:unnamed protein product, partial [Phaeothamnion confervicola]
MGGRPRDCNERTRHVAAEVAALRKQAEAVAQEEQKLEGTSHGKQLAMVAELEEVLRPVADLWGAAVAVAKNLASWTRTPVTALDGAAVRVEHTKLRETLMGLLQGLRVAKRDAPAKAAQEALLQLESFEKDIPVVLALSSPEFRAQHWRQVSALAGVTLSREHPTTLQQLNELGALTDTKATNIVKIGAEATEEAALLRQLRPVELFVRDEAVLRL